MAEALERALELQPCAPEVAEAEEEAEALAPASVFLFTLSSFLPAISPNTGEAIHSAASTARELIAIDRIIEAVLNELSLYGGGAGGPMDPPAP